MWRVALRCRVFVLCSIPFSCFIGLFRCCVVLCGVPSHQVHANLCFAWWGGPAALLELVCRNGFTSRTPFTADGASQGTHSIHGTRGYCSTRGMAAGAFGDGICLSLQAEYAALQVPPLSC